MLCSFSESNTLNKEKNSFLGLLEDMDTRLEDGFNKEAAFIWCSRCVYDYVLLQQLDTSNATSTWHWAPMAKTPYLPQVFIQGVKHHSTINKGGKITNVHILSGSTGSPKNHRAKIQGIFYNWIKQSSGSKELVLHKLVWEVGNGPDKINTESRKILKADEGAWDPCKGNIWLLSNEQRLDTAVVIYESFCLD